MKKNTVLSIVLLLSLLLSACSVAVQGGAVQAEAAASTPAPKTGAGEATAQAPAPNTTPPAGGAAMGASMALQLALGTVKLEETDYPVDADQARQLLPLWKAARSLSQSETTAQAEVDALFRQIQNTLTPEQMQAITAMDLSMQDMAAVGEQLGLALAPGGGFGNADPEMQATMQAARESGQMPPGGGPEGGMPGGGPPGGGDFGGGLSPEAQQTAMAERSARGATLGLPSELMDALIAFLETKIQ
ncbi:MAG: hypothetical protein AB1894_08730 [Chloroflexota bacterium]